MYSFMIHLDPHYYLVFIIHIIVQLYIHIYTIYLYNYLYNIILIIYTIYYYNKMKDMELKFKKFILFVKHFIYLCRLCTYNNTLKS